MILTFCIIFQFESMSSDEIIRVKMKGELIVRWNLTRWQGITTKWIIWKTQPCIWATVINSQWIIAEMEIFIFADFTMKNIKTYQSWISKCRKLNWINCPIGSWIFQVQSIPFRYDWGNPGDVITPKGCVMVTLQTES